MPFIDPVFCYRSLLSLQAELYSGNGILSRFIALYYSKHDSDLSAFRVGLECVISICSAFCKWNVVIAINDPCVNYTITLLFLISSECMCECVCMCKNTCYIAAAEMARV